MTAMTEAPPMLNVEGDYDEIVAWMDGNPVEGVEHYMSHGWTKEGNLNVGLFSVCADHEVQPSECFSCMGMGGSSQAFECDFDLTEVPVDTDGWYGMIAVDNPEHTHLIRF